MFYERLLQLYRSELEPPHLAQIFSFKRQELMVKLLFSMLHFLDEKDCRQATMQVCRTTCTAEIAFFILSFTNQGTSKNNLIRIA